MKKRKLLCLVLALMMIATSVQYVSAAEGENAIFINEIESDSVDTNDYIELINTGTTDIDISGWFVSDNKGLERLNDIPFDIHYDILPAVFL